MRLKKHASMTGMGSGMSKIDETIYLGPYMAVGDPENPVDIIISALSKGEIDSYKIKDYVGNAEWHPFFMDDTDRQDISQFFLPVCQILDKAKEEGKRVLVHCAAGVSRSPTLVIAYIMWSQKKSRKEAYEYVSSRRRIIDPNDSFMDQLAEFEAFLRRL